MLIVSGNLQDGSVVESLLTVWVIGAIRQSSTNEKVRKLRVAVDAADLVGRQGPPKGAAIPIAAIERVHSLGCEVVTTL